MTNKEFKIINGTDLFEHEKQFIKLYNNHTIPVDRIPAMLGISRNNMNRLRKRCIEKGTIKQRPKNNKLTNPKYFGAKYYYYDKANESYTIKRKNVYYGSVKTEEMAKKYVPELEKAHWDKKLSKKIKQKIIKEEVQ